MKNLSRINFALIALLLISGQTVLAQSTILKLPTTDNTSSFDITKSDSTSIFKLFGDGGFYAGGIFGIGEIPIDGPGSRLMWYPNKSAFRVGRVIGAEWDISNIGEYSIAMGNNTIASGNNSTSTGAYTIASGINSVAMGNASTASGIGSVAIGTLSTASGYISFTLGYRTISSGAYSTALGANVSTNGYTGSFIIGDVSTNGAYTNSSGENQMTMRFAGGYRLFTNSASNIGAYLTPNSNSWTAVSDSTKKENFINSNGEYFLSSLSKLKLGSWNYKTQDSKEYRHYGPMAQEIFHYFGKDEVGTIGNDTTLATADMDGIMMIMLQALEKRTAELNEKQSELKKANEKIEKANTEITELKKMFIETQEITDAKIKSLNELLTRMAENNSTENEYSYLNEENKK